MAQRPPVEDARRDVEGVQEGAGGDEARSRERQEGMRSPIVREMLEKIINATNEEVDAAVGFANLSQEELAMEAVVALTSLIERIVTGDGEQTENLYPDDEEWAKEFAELEGGVAHDGDLEITVTQDAWLALTRVVRKDRG